MKLTTKQSGNKAEKQASDYLISQGFCILEHNYHKRYGEIDIIAQKDDTLIFVEVKMRKNPIFDTRYLISPSKQKKIIKVAKEYIARYDYTQKYCRFDVILIEKEKLTHIENAFF